MISQDEVTFDFDLGDLLSEIPKPFRKEALHEIGTYLVEAVLDHVGEGKSPVQGVRAFKKLNKTYADNEKSGDRLANLDLNGDMMDSLTYKVKGNTVTIGIFDGDQAPKAFNHNVGDTLPKRQFIPGKDQTFNKAIIMEVRSILDEWMDDNL